MTPHNLMPLVAAPLMLFAIWRRVRRQFGRQPIRRKRMTARIALFAVVGALMALSGLYSLRLLEGLLGGVLAGAALGLVGLRLTRFERDADGADAYFPNPWIGGALTVLLVARLAWRFSVLEPLSAPATAPQAMPALSAMPQSPLTLVVLGLMVGYYLSYYAGLLVHHRRFERSQAITAAAGLDGRSVPAAD